MKAPKGKPGRKSTFNEKDAAEIVARLSKGEPLAHICADDWMPAVRTVSDWRDAHPEFDADFARARDLGFDAIAADTLTIADDDSRDWEMIRDNEGHVTGIKVDGEHVTRSKLRIDTRLKLLAKWDPKRYGDKLALTDPDGDRLKVEVIKRVVIDANS